MGNFFGQSIQPSEFIKPFFIIVNAWLLHLWKNNENFKGWLWSILVIIPIIFLLLLQPDIGMTLLITLTWGFQLFLTGIPINSYFNSYFFNSIDFNIFIFKL